MTAEDLIKRLEQYPEEIRTVSLTLLKLQEGQDSIEKSLALLERETTLAVTSAMGEDKKPSFTNDLARKAEVARRMGQDPKAVNLRDVERTNKAAIETAKVELAALEHRQRNARAILDYLAATKRGE